MDNLEVNTNAFEFSEDEDDINIIENPNKFSEAVLFTSDWTTETILSLLKRKKILLNPRFQRRDAWSQKRKSKFIESLILGLPIPQIVLAENKSSKGEYIVLDGKQRLLSLLQFCGEGDPASNNNKFTLQGLDVLDEIERIDFITFQNNPEYSKLYDSFMSQTIRAVVIRNWPDMSFLQLVFLRLNTGSVQLSPQELRLAASPGAFSDYIDDRSVNSPTLKELLQITEPDFRMRDVELLVRFLAFQNFFGMYNGNMKVFLDYTYLIFNEYWDEHFINVEKQLGAFETAANALIEIFGTDNIARRPVTKGKRMFNRAAFDVLIYYFIDDNIRSIALTKKTEIVEAFTTTWSTNIKFSAAVEKTTKSMQATLDRFYIWGECLQQTLGITIPLPQLSRDNRIVFSIE